jgi:hypothetical protein
LVGNVLGSLAIVALVALIAIGLPRLDHSLSAARAVTDGVRLPVGGAVTIVPPSGATLDVSQTRPGDQRGTALFTVGTVRFAVVVAPSNDTLDEAADQLRGQITGRSGYQVTGDDHAVRSDTGVDGRAGVYSSPGRSGEYVVYVHDGRSVEVTVSGPDGDLRSVLPTVEASARSVAFGPRS